VALCSTIKINVKKEKKKNIGKFTLGEINNFIPITANSILMALVFHVLL